MEDLYEIDRRRGGFMDTYEGRGKEADVVLIPWKLLHMIPDFSRMPIDRGDNGIIEYDDSKVNVMLAAQGWKTPTLGHLDDFTQSWIIDVKSLEELYVLQNKMSALPTLLGATLTVAGIINDKAEVPVVIFLNPRMRTSRDTLREGFEKAESALKDNRKFSVEFDFSSVIQEWAENVLERIFLCKGAIICITNGQVFNHLYDWQNMVGCLCCLPCCMVANPVYRIQRKMKYRDTSIIVRDYTPVVWGAVGFHPDEQRMALGSLIELCGNGIAYRPITGDLCKTKKERSKHNARDMKIKSRQGNAKKFFFGKRKLFSRFSQKKFAAASDTCLFVTEYADNMDAIRITVNGEKVIASELMTRRKSSLLSDVESTSMSSFDNADSASIYCVTPDRSRKRISSDKNLMGQQLSNASYFSNRLTPDTTHSSTSLSTRSPSRPGGRRSMPSLSRSREASPTSNYRAISVTHF